MYILLRINVRTFEVNSLVTHDFKPLAIHSYVLLRSIMFYNFRRKMSNGRECKFEYL